MINVDKYWLNNSNNEHKKLILRFVCERFGVSLEEMTGESRKARIIIPRFIAIYMLYHRTSLKMKPITIVFNRKSHNAINNAIKAVENLLFSDHEFRKLFISLNHDILVEELSHGIPPESACDAALTLELMYKDAPMPEPVMKIYNTLKVIREITPMKNITKYDFYGKFIRLICTDSSLTQVGNSG